MEIIQQLAINYGYNYDVSVGNKVLSGGGSGAASNTVAWEAIVALGATFLVIWLVSMVAIYVVNSIFLMKLFQKAGVDGWRAWIPIYNSIKFLQLGGYPGTYLLFLLIPVVGWIIYYVFNCIAAYNIGLKLGKDGAWVVLYVFVGIIWLGILGLDKSTWSEKLGKASVAPEQSPA